MTEKLNYGLTKERVHTNRAPTEKKSNPPLPCSSKIPFGIFLSPELTTAFLCLRNLKHTHHVNLRNYI